MDVTGQDLRGSRFEHVDLTGATFRHVDLNHVEMRGVELVGVRIDGEVQDLVVNGVDVTPFVEAELDRRDPDRARMRPTDPEGFREAWDVVERLWAGTIERARTLDPRLRHASVDGEWSFVETLRHLVFATDAWVRRGVLGDPSPWHPLGLPWDQMPDTPGIPRDRTARPSLDEVLVLRHDRMRSVRALIDGLTEELLTADTEPVAGPGWPPPLRRARPRRAGGGGVQRVAVRVQDVAGLGPQIRHGHRPRPRAGLRRGRHCPARGHLRVVDGEAVGRLPGWSGCRGSWDGAGDGPSRREGAPGTILEIGSPQVALVRPELSVGGG